MVAGEKIRTGDASVGWPVTVGAEIDYNVPEIFDPKEDRRRQAVAAIRDARLIAKAVAAGLGAIRARMGAAPR